MPEAMPALLSSVRLVTFVDANFIHALANFVAHHHQKLKCVAPPLEVVALDDTTLRVCKRLLRGPRYNETCLPRPEGFDADEGRLNLVARQRDRDPPSHRNQSQVDATREATLELSFNNLAPT